MKRISVGLGLAGLLLAQTSPPPGTVTFTPGQPPTLATPAKLVATAGSGTSAVTCTLTGNAVPATSVTVACTVGTVTITPYTIAFTSGTAYTFQHNFNSNAVTVQLSELTGTTIQVQATANGSTPTSGSF